MTFGASRIIKRHLPSQAASSPTYAKSFFSLQGNLFSCSGDSDVDILLVGGIILPSVTSVHFFATESFQVLIITIAS